MKGLSVHFFLFILFLVGSHSNLPETLPDNLSLSSVPKSPETTEYIRQPDGMIVIHIPAGDFYAGSEKPLHYNHEKPSLNIRMSQFLIDKYEVSSAQYSLCIKAGKCTNPLLSAPDSFPRTTDLPVIGISHEQALHYCQWVKMSLPTEAQWEFAAKGRYSLTYPWGNNLHDQKTNQPVMDRIRPVSGNPPSPMPVTATNEPSAKSSFGLMHMAGNVSEWTMDDAVVNEVGTLQARPLSEEQSRDHRASNYKNSGNSPFKIIKGANYLTVFPVFQRNSYRSYAPEKKGNPYTGFRCALELPPENSD